MLFGIIALLQFGNSFALESASDPIEIEFQRLMTIRDCAGSPCAMKLKEKGVWKRPSGDALELVVENRALIHSFADLYQVPSIAIASVLVAEVSVNIQWDDRLQNAAAWTLGTFGEKALMNFGEWIGKPISIGKSQVNLNGLRQAYSKIKEVERSNAPSFETIQSSLVTYTGDQTNTIRVIAASIRKAIDHYCYWDIDVYDKPAVLVTLYSLGNVEKRAVLTYQECREPQLHFLGLFALKYQKEIETAIYGY